MPIDYSQYHKMKSGIYSIRNLVNGKMYVGSTVNIQSRKSGHFNLLRKNKSHSPKLQNAFNKYGEEKFVFEILEKCEISELKKRESFYLKKFQVVGNGYNHSYDVDCAARGIKRSQEFCKRVSERNKHQTEKQRLLSADRFKEYNKSKKGQPKSANHRLKISQSNMGKKLSPDQIEKQRKRLLANPINYWKGKKRSAEDCLKFSLSHLGKESGRSRAVSQFENGVFVNAYKSATHAARDLNISRSSIKNCLLGYSKSAGNYTWKYV